MLTTLKAAGYPEVPKPSRLSSDMFWDEKIINPTPVALAVAETLGKTIKSIDAGQYIGCG